ncbi:winged helix-turn-helix transcriptional regulator [Vallitalea guaymasensis]|uniref:Helix-turn-helix domain-containing protein n=1 Tax=Vallitalea guaymasensis TaxID=1185412 RepID=A0A8J8MDT6_9FIRM|nr:helix-turn-helix domain-containing protein [Vallitalea guaymasensis]QUH31111.1 helix-turn-helix domain-containing protein [Vallitalea guaymasensis]
MADKISEFKVVGKINTTISGKMLYMLLNELADKNGVVNISHRKLSEILGISKSAVSRNLRRLEENGQIYIRSRYTSDGGRLANEYIVR